MRINFFMAGIGLALFTLGMLIGNITSDRIGDPKFDPKLKDCLEQLKKAKDI